MINQIKNNLSIIIQNRLVHHFLFWTLSFYTLVQFFALQEDISKIDVVYTALFHISLLFGVYVNVLLLIPYLLKREKYVLYAICFVALWLAAAYLNEFTFEHLSDYIAPDYFFISSYEINELLKFSIVYLGLSTLLKLSKSWFRVIEAEKKLVELKQKQSETELLALKTNIHPHFLFNNLNSLYALARKKSDETPNYILQLSDLMRYMIYESNDEYVELEKEINYITNYLELQKLRCKNKTRIQYMIEGELGSQKIAPFLMIPFIENSFKHGGLNQLERDVIDLKIRIEEEQLEMNLRNSIPKQSSKEIDPIGGFGIENVKSRLNSLYPNKHVLNLSKQEDEFTVALKIDLNHEPNHQ
ncbi:sensor histidine kinase [Marinifilum sp. D737]|uniref:sensor histidine kinase n=1 Tax=Marinifilum sp. D737 TaxID=2969628 RepID=UPI002273EF69|nr:histidine kinase [Marinifilum sp. D737]MCY1633056.1 histidine kinase [Marinifilum sp. D737]